MGQLKKNNSSPWQNLAAFFANDFVEIEQIVLKILLHPAYSPDLSLQQNITISTILKILCKEKVSTT